MVKSAHNPSALFFTAAPQEHFDDLACYYARVTAHPPARDHHVTRDCGDLNPR